MPARNPLEHRPMPPLQISIDFSVKIAKEEGGAERCGFFITYIFKEGDMAKLGVVDWICMILIVIGGLNWLLWGIFEFNLVAAIFGTLSALARIVYILVGLAALYVLIFMLPKIGKKTAA
jgi:hypothetical protein